MGKLLEKYRRLLYDYESVLPYALLGLVGSFLAAAAQTLARKRRLGAFDPDHFLAHVLDQ